MNKRCAHHIGPLGRNPWSQTPLHVRGFEYNTCACAQTIVIRQPEKRIACCLWRRVHPAWFRTSVFRSHTSRLAPHASERHQARCPQIQRWIKGFESLVVLSARCLSPDTL